MFSRILFDMDNEEYLSIPQAALLVRVHIDTLHKAIRSGALPASRPYGHFLVLKSDLLQYRAQTRMGRPKKTDVAPALAEPEQPAPAAESSEPTSEPYHGGRERQRREERNAAAAAPQGKGA